MRRRLPPVFAAFMLLVFFPPEIATEARAEAVKRVIKIITRSDLEARREAEDAVPMALSEGEIMSVEATLGQDSRITRGLASKEGDGSLPEGEGGTLGLQAKSPAIAPANLRPNKQFVTANMVESAFSKGAPANRRKFFLSAGGSIDDSLGGMRAGDVSIGLLPEFMMFSVRLRFGQSNFGALRAFPASGEDPSLFPSGSDPESEYNRVRSDSDAWSFLLYDLGIGVQGKYLPYLLPNCSQRVRFLAGLGVLTDAVNELEFSAWHLAFESGLQWAPSERSSFALDLAAQYQYGLAIRQDAPSRNLGRLPFDWLGVTASIYLWL